MKTADPFLFVMSLALVLVLVAGCTSSQPGTTPSTPGPTQAAPPVPPADPAYYLVANNFAFNTSTMTVPAGSTVTIFFDNRDAGIPHNFAVSSRTIPTTVIFQGSVITGPSSTTYTFTAPPAGTYRFQCDIHPATMSGDFIVT